MTNPRRTYIDAVNRAAKMYAQINKRELQAQLDAASKGLTIDKTRLNQAIEDATRGVKIDGAGLNQAIEDATRGVKIDGAGLNQAIEDATRGVKIDGAGLNQAIEDATRGVKIDSAGLNQAIEDATRGLKIDSAGLNQAIENAARQWSPAAARQWKALAAGTGILNAYRSSAAALARAASAAAPIDLGSQMAQLREASDVAVAAAPDLVGEDASTEFVQAIVDDRDAYPEVTLDDVDQRIQAAIAMTVLQPTSADGDRVAPGKAALAAQQLLLMVLSVVVDRAIPEREELYRLILILVHLIRSLPR